jgi:hypothetical protein
MSIIFDDDLAIIPDTMFAGMVGVHGDTIARKDKRIAAGQEVDPLWPKRVQISPRRFGRRRRDVRRLLNGGESPPSAAA